MKRLLVTGPSQSEFAEAPMPECGPDQLLVRATVTTISTGTEIRVYRNIPVDDDGEWLHGGVAWEMPTENGYSMVGVVEEAGRDVTGFSVGERVFVPETHKQYAAPAAERAVKIPDGIPDEHAVFIAILQVAHNALRTADPTPGDNVAVVGQGVIGLAATAYCNAFGNRTVALDVDPDRRAMALEMGAGLAVSPMDDGFEDAVRGHFNGDGADVAIEAASVWPAIQTSLDLIRKGGRVVVVARHTDMPAFNLVGHPYLMERITLMTSRGFDSPGGRWDYDRSVRLTLDLMTEGRINIEPMITHRLGWQELPDAYTRLGKGDGSLIGVVLRWSD